MLNLGMNKTMANSVHWFGSVEVGGRSCLEKSMTP